MSASSSHSFSSKFITGLVTALLLWYFEFGKMLFIWIVNLFRDFVNFVFRQGVAIELGVSLVITMIIMQTFVGTILTEFIDRLLKRNN